MVAQRVHLHSFGLEGAIRSARRYSFLAFYKGYSNLPYMHIECIVPSNDSVCINLWTNYDTKKHVLKQAFRTLELELKNKAVEIHFQHIIHSKMRRRSFVLAQSAIIKGTSMSSGEFTFVS